MTFVYSSDIFSCGGVEDPVKGSGKSVVTTWNLLEIFNGTNEFGVWQILLISYCLSFHDHYLEHSAKSSFIFWQILVAVSSQSHDHNRQCYDYVWILLLQNM